MGKINGHSYVSSFSSPSKSGYAGLQAGKAHVCVEKAVSISLSIIQSNAMCQTVSLGPQRDAGRVEIRHIALPSG